MFIRLSRRHCPGLLHPVMAIGLLVLALVTSGSCVAQQPPTWNSLGPPGGFMNSVETDPSQALRVYASAQVNSTPGVFYRTADGGNHWETFADPPDCGYAGSYARNADRLVVRSDGQVFRRCAQDIWRSRNGGTSWERFSPAGVDGWLVFDSRDPRRAAIRSGHLIDPTAAALVRADDGATWRTVPLGPGGGVPQAIRFDPATPGRLLGAYADPTTYNGGGPAWLWESRDGDTWRVVSQIAAPAGDGPSCFVRNLVADAGGQLFAHTDCGLARSIDHGQTWQRLTTLAPNFDAILIADATRPGHLLALDTPRELVRSRDGGETWTKLTPPVPQVADVGFDAAGGVWVATIVGMFRTLDDGKTWERKDTGISDQFVTTFAVGEGVPRPLAVMAGYAGGATSLDGGATWLWRTSDLTELAASLHAPQWIYALNYAGVLHLSVNNGIAWSVVNPKPDLGPHVRLGSLVPVGPQPGLIYALALGYSDFPGSPPPLVGKSVVRSLDGGLTWTQLGADLPPPVEHLAVSPADPLLLLVSAGNGVHAMLDAATDAQWRRVSTQRGVPTLDPVAAGTWYLHGEKRPFEVSHDRGSTWSALGDPLQPSPNWALVIDPTTPGTLLSIGSKGAVSHSRDGGSTWRRIVEPNYTFDVRTEAVQFVANPPIVYAGSSRGLSVLSEWATASMPTVTAVEFYRPDLQHYFITTDPLEIALLDTGGRMFWKRSGESFKVYAPSTRVEVTSPVCRFYGKPTMGLDSHFFSASPQECAEVQARFSNAWVYESPSAFSAFLPALDGACPAGTPPIYRVYNGRSDINHRYTASRVVRDAMVAAGWIAEGYGADAVAMCGAP